MRVSKQRNLWNLCCSQTFTYTCLYSFCLQNVNVCLGLFKHNSLKGALLFLIKQFQSFFFEPMIRGLFDTHVHREECLLVPFSLPNPETGQGNTYLRKCFPPSVYLLRGYFILLKRNRLFLRVKFIQSKILKSDSPKSLVFSFVLLLVYFSCNVAFIWLFSLPFSLQYRFLKENPTLPFLKTLLCKSSSWHSEFCF